MKKKIRIAYLILLIVLLCSCQIKYDIPSDVYKYELELYYLDGGKDTISILAYGDLEFKISSKFGSYWLNITNQSNVNHPNYIYFKNIDAVTRYKLISKKNHENNNRYS